MTSFAERRSSAALDGLLEQIGRQVLGARFGPYTPHERPRTGGVPTTQVATRPSAP